MARSVEDAARLLQVIAGHDPKDSTSVDRPVPDYLSALSGNGDLKGLTIGLCPPNTGTRALRPRWRGLRSIPENRRGARRQDRSREPAALAVRHRHLLPHRHGRGLLQPGPLRRRALRLPRAGRREPAGHVQEEPHPGLRRRGPAPHHPGHLRALLRLLRRLLPQSRPGPPPHPPGFRGRAFPVRPAGRACVPDHGLQGGRNDIRPLADVPDGHLHHQHQPGRAAGDEFARRPWRATPGCRWACSSRAGLSTRRQCSRPPHALEAGLPGAAMPSL